jgi:hypothetical protein
LTLTLAERIITAYRLTIVTGKGMAAAGWRVLTDDEAAASINRDFAEDQKDVDFVREGW